MDTLTFWELLFILIHKINTATSPISAGNVLNPHLFGLDLLIQLHKENNSTQLDRVHSEKEIIFLEMTLKIAWNGPAYRNQRQ